MGKALDLALPTALDKLQNARWAHEQVSCLFLQVLAKRKWQSLAQMLASAEGEDTLHGGTSKTCHSTRLCWIAGTLSPAYRSCHHEAGCLTTTTFTRQRHLHGLHPAPVSSKQALSAKLPDFVGTTSFSLTTSISENPSTIIFALKWTSRETKPH